MVWKNRQCLDTDQFRDSSKLRRGALLHKKYDTNSWFGFVAGLTGFAPGMSVLDIGCGAGWFWEKCAERFPAALDITLAGRSTGMVEEALARLNGVRRWRHIAGVVTNVCAMPFADRSFDRVLAMHMLCHAEAFGLPAGLAIDFVLESAPPLLEAGFGAVELKRNTSEMVVTDPADVFSYPALFPPGDDASEAELQVLGRLADDAFAAGGACCASPSTAACSSAANRVPAQSQ